MKNKISWCNVIRYSVRQKAVSYPTVALTSTMPHSSFTGCMCVCGSFHLQLPPAPKLLHWRPQQRYIESYFNETPLVCFQALSNVICNSTPRPHSVLSTYPAMKWFSGTHITAPSSSLDGLFPWELVKSYDTQQFEAIKTGGSVYVGVRTLNATFVPLKALQFKLNCFITRSPQSSVLGNFRL